MGAAERRTVFFEPAPELGNLVEFGFAAARYRRRPGSQIHRLPTTRGTLYFAAHVSGPGLGYREAGLYCEGPHAGAFEVTHESGEIVALKVRPGALGALLGVPAREVRDRTLDLMDLWGRRAHDIAARVASARGTAERIRVLQREVDAGIRRGAHSMDGAIEGAAMLSLGQGRARIEDVSKRCGVSPRTLLHRFDDGVGLRPKQYARLVRMRSALARLVSSRSRDCSDAAMASGYVDQAHMIHEFRSLIGLSPLEYLHTPAAFGPEGAVATGASIVPRCERTLYRSAGFVDRWAAPQRCVAPESVVGNGSRMHGA